MGFSDAGCYGGEIQTPNLDKLAAGGLRFTQFYNTARCWPSRACILTGYYAQQVNRDELPGGGGGVTGRRPAWARLLPELLRPLGYRSYHSGKWHVDGTALEGGFDLDYDNSDTDHHFIAAGKKARRRVSRARPRRTRPSANSTGTWPIMRAVPFSSICASPSRTSPCKRPRRTSTFTARATWRAGTCSARSD